MRRSASTSEGLRPTWQLITVGDHRTIRAMKIQRIGEKHPLKKKRRALREEYFPDVSAWDSLNEKGWFKAPRTLPLLLSLLRDKKLSGNKDPSAVYLELLARHMSDGIIEMISPEEHAFHAGYRGARATRTWRERMRILEARGFIKCKPKGNLDFGLVVLVHPSVVARELRSQPHVVSERWWTAYATRRSEIGERTVAEAGT